MKQRTMNEWWATTSPTTVNFGEVASNVGGFMEEERTGYFGLPGRGAAREAVISARRVSNKRARAARRKQRGR